MLERLRKFLRENSAHYLLVNSCDEYLLEYVQNNSRHKLTGFSGSAGDALLSEKKLFLFVDGRYHQQAGSQTDKNIVDVVKLKMGDSFIKEICKKIKSGKTLLMCSKKISLKFYNELKKNLDLKGVKLETIDFDPVFEDAVASYEQNIEDVNIELCSETSADKIGKIQATLDKKDGFLITKLDDIAYLTNKRSYDTPFCASFRAKLFIWQDGFRLFFNNEIDGFNFNNFEKIFVDESSINYFDYKKIEKIAQILDENPISKMRSIKNEAEIKHLKKCFEKSDVLLNYIDGLINSEKIYSEFELAQEVEKKFLELGAKSLSFKTILAAGKNSSIIHYSDPSKDVFINNGDFVLLDCGAYFEGGLATDATRTFFKGDSPIKKQKTLYTTVLRAFLAVYSSKLISGFNLDKKARKIIQESVEKNNSLKGFEFNHGTGHGVGVCVHDGLPSVSLSELAKKPLEVGMVFTIEPGLYKKNFGGVRLENTVFIDENKKMQSFSHFKFEEKLIDFSMLSKKEADVLKKLF